MGKTFAKFLLGFIFFSASGDLFFVINFGGGVFRMCYILILALFFFTIVSTKKVSLNNVGRVPLLIWTLFSFVFVFNIENEFLSRNILYFIQFFILLVFLYSIVSLNRFFTYIELLKIYINSFYFISVFSIIQYFLYLIGIKFLITQSFFSGRLPRLSGISYEPSYYGTYMIVGWTILVYLTFRGLYIYNKRNQLIKLGMISLVILLSTSRMTILVLILVLLFLIVPQLVRLIKSKMNIISLSIFSIFTFVFVVFFIYMFNNREALRNFTNGIGYGSNANHSVKEREIMTGNTFKAFKKSKFKGVSFGGIDIATAKIEYNTEIIDKRFIGKISDRDSDFYYNSPGGLNIFLEQLVAVGIFGYIFFALYICSLFYFPIRLRKKLKFVSKEDVIILNAILLSLFVELTILIFNANIIRIYLWTLIGVLNFIYFGIKAKYYQNKKLAETTLVE